MGNLFGASWAYVELGWGGYWAWDPVENAAFMPLLIATAFLHSVMIQEKKGHDESLEYVFDSFDIRDDNFWDFYHSQWPYSVSSYF
jgi:cytochrome c biogenesis factor